jgi:hypothetical protein
MSREAMQMALEALEDAPYMSNKDDYGRLEKVTEALHKAINSEQFLTQEDIALRWGISGATLERDRSLKQGMRYLKIGGLIRYRLQDVLDYEAECTVETERRKK